MTQPLGYESRDRNALETGERVLWDDADDLQQQPRYRLTNRRGQSLRTQRQSIEHNETMNWPFRDVMTVIIPRNGCATLRLGGGLWLRKIKDWPRAVAVVGAVNHIRRYARPRRNSHQPTMSTATPATSDSSIGISSIGIDLDLGLLADEKILWTGKPRSVFQIEWPALRRQLVTLAYTLVPAVTLWYVFHEPRLGGLQVGLIGVAAIWILTSLRMIFINPFTTAAKLRKTRYLLTTRRALCIEPMLRGKRIRFIFLDALPATFSRSEKSDGSGELTVDPQMAFRNIEQVAAIQNLLVQAVLSARQNLPDLGWQEITARAVD